MELDTRIIYFFFLFLVFSFGSCHLDAQLSDSEEEKQSLCFFEESDGSFSFHTGMLNGRLRFQGKSVGLYPVSFMNSEGSMTVGEGLFNHYRVFTRGVRYGYGARRWPGTAKLNQDGSVEVKWASTPDRPFELKALYRWVGPATLDLITSVTAVRKLNLFEVFLASYFSPEFTDSRVYISKNSEGKDSAYFLSAKRKYGEWLVFPRDHIARNIIKDGRWDLEPHPLEWTLMPEYAFPLGFRRDSSTGITVIMMAQPDDCFGFYTPWEEEKHLSMYQSLFGVDIEQGETLHARTRLVILKNPSANDIIRIAEEYFKTDK